MAATDLFYLSSVLFVVLIALIWFTRPSKDLAGRRDVGGGALNGGAMRQPGRAQSCSRPA